MEDLKKQRTKERSSLTRLESKIRRLVQENDPEEVYNCMIAMKQKYLDFERSHDAIHDQLVEVVEIEESDVYIVEVQDKYSESLEETRNWLDSIAKQEKEVEDADKSKDEAIPTEQSITQEMLAMLNLPKLELDSFDGDPLQYHGFMSVFNDTVEKVVKDGTTRLTRLLQYTKGAAKQAIQPCSIIGGDKGYLLAKVILQERFGNDLIISERLISILMSGKPVKSAVELQVLANDMLNCNVILSKMHKVEELNSQRFIASIVNRLQTFQKNRWKKYAMDMKRRDHKYPDFNALVMFVKSEAEQATDPVYGESGLLRFTRNQVPAAGSQPGRPSGPPQQKSSGSQQNRFHNTSFASSKGRTVMHCAFCGDDHRLYLCDSYKALKSDQKLKVIVDKKLCENCLLSNHMVDRCLRPSMCGIGGCQGKHSRFIHQCRVDNNQSNSGKQTTSGFTNVCDNVCIPMVQVKVNNKYTSLALLDTCSTGTFCTKRLANKLGLKGVAVKYELSTLNNKCLFQETSLIPNLIVQSESNDEMTNLRNVHIVDDIPMKNVTTDISKFKHLKDLPEVPSRGELDILIGQDNSEVLIPLEVRVGETNQPFAVRTMLGWSLQGYSDEGISVNKTSNKVVSHFIVGNKVKNDYEMLDEKVERLWKIEDEGLGLDNSCTSMSNDDLNVLKFWDDNVTVVEGHYELPIPWKPDVSVPDNHELALSRLKSLKKGLDRKGIYERYDKEIQKLLDKGYAESIPKPKFPNSKILYLPHHAVITEKKPDKLRVVFDCAAQYQGESLNDKCRQGPDLNNKLIHVLLRFRQHRYAIMGDVEAMYYQVKVKEEDRDALRFLWFDEAGEVIPYRMNAHVFGGVWCACIATYAMRRTVKDQNIKDEDVKDVIERSFYVDDCLKSAESVKELEKVIYDVKEVLQEGGFRLTKFVANEEEVLNKIGETERAKEVKQFDEGARSKALGIGWNIREDSFYVIVGGSREIVARRDMLSSVASMYDPLGLVSPCVMIGKMLFQDATRLRLDWNQKLPDDLIEKWYRWTEGLDELRSLSFPRCITSNAFDQAKLELHTFCDASERAYGCCSYLKCIDKKGEVSISLVTSKGRICPIKQVTIPRLELQAAVMAAQINNMLCKELDLHINQSYFWTDSQIVLAYIRNMEKRFKTYVANRVSMIRNLSNPDQWNFIAGKNNPADYISRGASPKQLMSSMWREGPEFLKDNDLQMKTEVSAAEFEIPVEDPEVKKVVSHMIDVREETSHPIDQIIQYFSSWYKVKRIVSWLLKIRSRLREKIAGKQKTTSNEITLEDLNRAETVIMKHVQSQVYQKEIRSLKGEVPINKSSNIRGLLPILNEEGIVCVGGRIKT